MPLQLRSRGGDLLIRTIGVIMIPLGARSIQTLYQAAHAGPQHSATGLEVGLAAASFVCLSLGSMLLVLGAHFFDEIEVSARWALRSHVRTSPGAEELLNRPHPIHSVPPLDTKPLDRTQAFRAERAIDPPAIDDFFATNPAGANVQRKTHHA